MNIKYTKLTKRWHFAYTFKKIYCRIFLFKNINMQTTQGTNKFLFFGKRIPPLCPKGYLGIVTGYHATTQFWFCNMSYHSHSGDSSDNVVLFERYGKKQFIILASIQCSSHQIHIKFLRHSCRLVIDRYPVFIYTCLLYTSDAADEL